MSVNVWILYWYIRDRMLWGVFCDEFEKFLMENLPGGDARWSNTSLEL